MHAMDPITHAEEQPLKERPAGWLVDGGEQQKPRQLQQGPKRRRRRRRAGCWCMSPPSVRQAWAGGWVLAHLRSASSDDDEADGGPAPPSVVVGGRGEDSHLQ